MSGKIDIDVGAVAAGKTVAAIELVENAPKGVEAFHGYLDDLRFADAPDEVADPLAGSLDVLPVGRVGAHTRDCDQLRQLGAPGLVHGAIVCSGRCASRK